MRLEMGKVLLVGAGPGAVDLLVRTRLDGLGDAVTAAGFTGPVLLVIGEAAGRALATEEGDRPNIHSSGVRLMLKRAV